MILDARSFPQEHVVDTDVCILGGGVAGLTLAREFAGQHVDVCVLEQGGFDEETEAQKLNRGEVTGYPYWGLDYARHAQVGGSSHRWGLTLSDGRTGARFRPLDAIDFERRPEIPHSGWPFSKTELDSYYDRAQALFHLGPNRYRPDEWEGAEDELLLRESPSLQTVLFQYGPRKSFTEWHRDAVAKAKNVRIIHHARVLSVETTQSGRTASHVRVASLEGPEFAVRARTFVLALGGIENARLLLASKRTHESGLGNQHDLVGRFFMEHLHLRSGLLWPAQEDVFSQAGFYHVHDRQGTSLHGKLALREEVLRQERLRNSCFSLGPMWNPDTDFLRESEAFDVARVVRSTLQGGYLPDQPLSKLKTLITKSGPLWRRLGDTLKKRVGIGPKGRTSPVAFSLHHFAEQAPNPNSRVRLSTRKTDRYGQPRAHLHWAISGDDVRDILRGLALVKPEVERTGEWRLEIPDYDQLPPAGIRGGFHHMGTTRMHDNPRYGVVNANGQVHGIDNLFVTGASVFPTGGYANPTLTIGAMALRLSDHLKQKLQEPFSQEREPTSVSPHH